MKHIHSVYDTDSHFSISPITRAIKNESSKKTTVMQYDHNSERFTFEMPREIEGHDMTLCNKVELHYINVASDNSGQSKGVYLIDDLQTSPEDESVVICSWLISKKATKFAGTLSFRLRFACIDENAKVTYAWHTEIFKGVSVSNGIDNAESVHEEYSDILEAWKKEIYEPFDKALSDMADYDGKLEELSSSVANLKVLHTDFTHTVYPTEAQKAKKDMRGWYRIAETTKAGYWSNMVHLQVEVLRSARSSDVIFTIERMNYQDSPSIGVLSYGNQTNAYKAVDNLRVVYLKNKSGEKSYLEVHINQNAIPDDAWDGTGISTGYKFTAETHFHSKNNWSLIEPTLVPTELEEGWTSYEKSPLTSAWSKVTASVDDINNLATQDYVNDEIIAVNDEISDINLRMSDLISSNESLNEETKLLINLLHPTKKIELAGYDSNYYDIYDLMCANAEYDTIIAKNAIKYELIGSAVPNEGIATFEDSALPFEFWKNLTINLSLICDEYDDEYDIGINEGTIVSVNGYLEEGISDYILKSITGTRGESALVVEGDVFYFNIVVQLTFTVISATTNEEVTETYNILYENDYNDGTFECFCTILENEQTKPLLDSFATSTYDLRTQSIDRQLRAVIEEARARREAARANKEET